MKRFIKFCNDIIHKDSFLRVISVFIAILLWLYILSISDFLRTERYTKVPIIIEEAGSVPDRNDLIMLLKDKKLFVTVTVSGPSAAFVGFKQDNIKATLNLDPVVSPTKYNLKVIVDTGDSQINVDTVYPSTIPIEFSKKKTKSFTIDIATKGTLPENYYQINSTLSPTEVDITGPEKYVNSINKVIAEINIDGQKSLVSAEPNLLFLDNMGNNVNTDFLTIDYKQAAVTVDIAYQKTIPLKFTPYNNKYGGDETSYTTYSYSPIKEITVQGNESVVKILEYIDLGRFSFETDITRSPLTFSASLPFSTDYKYTGIPIDLKTIDVTVDLGDAEINNIRFNKAQFDNFTFINVPLNKIPVITSKSATLSIRSLPYILDRINASSFIGTVDLSKQNENGNYPVSFTIPGETSYGLMNQVYVSVDFQE
ncbi:MAG: hypothetical protein K0S55_406 [Clostridia bacterium]|nr:hypothetical protein [Clostridia bacterium]